MGELEPCIQVGILDFNQLKSKGFHHRILLMDEKTNEEHSSKFLFHVIELKKLDETPKEEQNELYHWAKLIAAKDWEAVCMEAKGNPYMEEARDEMHKINQDEVERWLYLRRQMALSDEASRKRTAENQGMKKGMEKGIRKGIRKGEQLKLICQIKKKYLKGKPLEVIADEVEESVDDIRPIYQHIADYPQESEETLYNILYSQNEKLP